MIHRGQKPEKNLEKQSILYKQLKYTLKHCRDDLDTTSA